MILSGSGNQGITASVPVVRYARHLGADQEKLYRALLVSDLVTIDLSRPVTQEEMDAAEDKANRNIYENHPIRCYIASPEEVDRLTLRKKDRKGRWGSSHCGD